MVLKDTVYVKFVQAFSWVTHSKMESSRHHPRQISPTTVILIFTFVLFCAVSVFSRIANAAGSNEWDVLIFTQNWPNTVCLEWHEKRQGNTCIMPPFADKWSIHGIWPTKFGTEGPWFCDPSRKFSEQEIYGLEPELEERWTPIEHHKKKYMLWKHEWEKHGTCAASLEALKNQFDYFDQGLEWSKEYEMSAVLAKAGVLPSEAGYDPEDVWKRVSSTLGKHPFIMCYTEPKTKISFLQEIRICFNKNLTLVDCDGIKSPGAKNKNVSLIQCPTGKPTLYLKKLPPFINDDWSHITPDHPIINTLKAVKLVQWLTL